MGPAEKDIVIKKIMELPPEQVSKVLAFIDELESAGSVQAITLMKGDDKRTGNVNVTGKEEDERNVIL